VDLTLTYLITYLRSSAFPEKLPIAQPFRIFPAILRNPKVHHRVHKSPLLAHILSQFDPVHTIPSYLSKIHFNIVRHLRLGLTSGLFPSVFPTISYMCSSYPHSCYMSCPSHHPSSFSTYLLTYGAEPFLRSSQFCTHSGYSQQF
jgi:hypothetical protein